MVVLSEEACDWRNHKRHCRVCRGPTIHVWGDLVEQIPTKLSYSRLEMTIWKSLVRFASYPIFFQFHLVTYNVNTITFLYFHILLPYLLVTSLSRKSTWAPRGTKIYLKYLRYDLSKDRQKWRNWMLKDFRGSNVYPGFDHVILVFFPLGASVFPSYLQTSKFD